MKHNNLINNKMTYRLYGEIGESMKELTMKEKIDKIIDKNEELKKMTKEFEIPFYNDYETVCLLKDAELEYYAKLLGQTIITNIFANGTSETHSHKKFFFYRGVRFYMLIKREEVGK